MLKDFFVKNSVLLVFILFPVLLRVLLIHSENIGFEFIDVYGVVSDLSVGILILLGLVFLKLYNKYSILFISSILVLLYAANYGHVQVNKENIDFYYIKYIFDPIFLKGTLGLLYDIEITVAAISVFSLAAYFALVCLFKNYESFPRAQLFVSFSLLALALALMPKSPEQSNWRQYNIVHANANNYIYDSAPLKIKAFMEEQSRESLKSNNKYIGSLYSDSEIGIPKFDFKIERPNIVLVLLEGISNEHIKLGWTPNLESLSKDGLYYPNFVAMQRQTNRGEYSILCGAYPNLRLSISKMSFYEDRQGEADDCLPKILNEAGYQTRYIQAADLPFMLKDNFMKEAGFSKVYGDLDFERGYANGGWGVDDRTLFEQSFLLVKDGEINEDGPSFTTILTSGTHHPYTIPEGYMQDEANRQIRAIHYADKAIGEFVSSLKENGSLENTIVLITSDESLGVSHYKQNIRNKISHHSSFLIALTPNKAKMKVEGFFLQSDIQASILDLLKIEKESQISSRSIFRDYSNQRNFMFGNAYSRNIFLVNGKDQELDICDYNLNDCKRFSFEDERLFTEDLVVREINQEDIVEIQDNIFNVLSLNEDDGDQKNRRWPLVQLGRQIMPAGKINTLSGGQYFEIDDDTLLTVKTEIEVLEGALGFYQDFVSGGPNYHYAVRTILPNKSKMILEYDFVPNSSLVAAEVLTKANALNREDAHIDVKQSYFRTKRRGPPSVNPIGIHNERLHIERLNTGEVVTIDMLSSPLFVRSDKCDKPCVQIHGPFMRLPAGSIIEAEYVIEANGGSFYNDIKTKGGFLAPNAGLSFDAPATKTLSNRAVLSFDEEGIETRLHLYQPSEDGFYKVNSAILTITYPLP